MTFFESVASRRVLYSLGSAIALMSVLLFVGEEINALLRYSRNAILDGEIWRLLSAHIVHSNPAHGAMNIAALILVVLLVGKQLRFSLWLFASVFLALSISSALLLFTPEVAWYVGFSGVLHGLLALGLVLGCIDGDKLHVLALLLLCVKIVREQLPGFDAHHLQSVIAAAVIVDAHLYGAVAGVFLALTVVLLRRVGYAIR